VAEGLTQMFVAGTSTRHPWEKWLTPSWASRRVEVASVGSITRSRNSLKRGVAARGLARLSRALSRWHLPGSDSWRPGRPHHHCSSHGSRSGRQHRDACHQGVRHRSVKRAGCVCDKLYAHVGRAAWI
jgi:hypothetical protein